VLQFILIYPEGQLPHFVNLNYIQFASFDEDDQILTLHVSSASAVKEFTLRGGAALTLHRKLSTFCSD